MTDRLLTREQAAEKLGIKASTLASWHCEKREPRPPVIVIGTRTIRYSESALDDFIKQQTEQH